MAESHFVSVLLLTQYQRRRSADWEIKDKFYYKSRQIFTQMSKELQRKAVYIVANNVILKNATWPKLFSISSELTLVLQIQEERMLTILKAFQSYAKLYLLLDIPLGRAPIGTWWKSRAPSTRQPLTKLNHSASGKEKNWVNTRQNDKPLEYHYSCFTIEEEKKKGKDSCTLEKQNSLNL